MQGFRKFCTINPLCKYIFKKSNFLSLAESDQEIEIKIFFIILSISLISQAGDLLISFAKDNQRLKIQAKLFQAMEEY